MVYTTKQQQAVLRCLEQRPDEALTATDLAADLREAGHPVGMATIYRQLEKLEKGSYRVLVNPKDISRMNGQKRNNIQSLAALGYDITVKGDERIKPLYPTVDRL